MFDPVHNGHLEAARVAVRTLELDELRLVPCAIPNHRTPALASAQDRLAMLELAIAQDDALLVDDREITRDGVSYTVDTLASLAEEFPGAVLVLVLGIDAFASLPGWYRWQAIFALANVVVLARPGVAPQFNEDLTLDLQCRQAHNVDRFFSQPQGRILCLQEPQVDLSSTQVRTSVQQGQDARAVLPPAVADYIRSRGLYASSGTVSDTTACPTACSN